MKLAILLVLLVFLIVPVVVVCTLVSLVHMWFKKVTKRDDRSGEGVGHG